MEVVCSLVLLEQAVEPLQLGVTKHVALATHGYVIPNQHQCGGWVRFVERWRGEYREMGVSEGGEVGAVSGMK